ncbi:MAG: hypothetical protein GVY06_08075 [Alphaproteobacteria bacterium]|jgi:hypothetical protein|nr:hypothetical protein [Alphaproteobacteria bacterium]
MSLWEKNTYLLGLGSAVGGVVYFSLVAWQSIQLGFLAPPSVATWLSYIAIQITFSFAATSLLARKERQEVSTVAQLRGGEDERDQFVRKQSEAFFWARCVGRSFCRTGLVVSA